jgi:hypothetical protein
LEYRFLGKMTDRGVTTVVLHAAGRTLKVRGLGPVDDEYAVDTLQDGYLVLRDIRRGTSRLVEFTSPPPTTAAAWTAGETPPD